MRIRRSEFLLLSANDLDAHLCPEALHLNSFESCDSILVFRPLLFSACKAIFIRGVG